MDIRIVIGKNFGDEGKGLAVDYFAGRFLESGASCLVIRHNGGAQAGHTVELPGIRFVFHQLSAGSFRRAHTFWSDTFLPDLYKLRDETEAFARCSGNVPPIFASGRCRCVVIDDVLLNMAAEQTRGRDRHGSCGMGINEAVVRSGHEGMCLNLEDVRDLEAEGLYRRLREMRKAYVPVRMQELGLTFEAAGEYGELLRDDNVLWNAARVMCENVSLVSVDDTVLTKYDSVIFEGAQGLLLDEEYHRFAPHLTSSRTGLHNPARICRALFPGIRPEVVYITRPYITRHGAGPLPYEGMNGTASGWYDETNRPNEWQGALRFAPHGTVAEFLKPVEEDLRAFSGQKTVSLMVTHADETDYRMLTVEGAPSISEWAAGKSVNSLFDRLYMAVRRRTEGGHHEIKISSC